MCFWKYSPLKSCSMCKLPCMPSQNVAFPFPKQNNYMEKNIVTFVVLVLCFSLAYFSLCDCSWVVIFPSRHLSPCQHGEAHCRQYPCLWTHIDDALSLRCDSLPLLTTFSFFLQPRWEDGLFVMLNVFCVFVAETYELPTYTCLHKQEGVHEKLQNLIFLIKETFASVLFRVG